MTTSGRDIGRNAQFRRTIRRKSPPLLELPDDPDNMGDNDSGVVCEDDSSFADASNDVTEEDFEAPKSFRSYLPSDDGSEASASSFYAEGGAWSYFTSKVASAGSALAKTAGYFSTKTMEVVSSAFQNYLANDKEDQEDDEWVDSADVADDVTDVVDADAPDGAVVSVEDTGPSEETLARLFNIAKELHATEEAYVKRLEVLVEVKEKSKKYLKEDAIRAIFHDVDVIYKFHKEYLLPELHCRIEKWETNRGVGDIMKRLSPFLKLYTQYVKEFDNANQMLRKQQEQNSAFAAFLKQESTGFSQLTIGAHMLEPIQRVPRYELLLRDYLRRLPPTAPDYADTKKALEHVADAAAHFEMMMKRDTKLAKLIEIQNLILILDASVAIVRPGRELIREGCIGKVTRTGKVALRQAYLFNDLLVLCTAQQMLGKYRLKNALELRNVQLSSNENQVIPNTFYLKSKRKVLELCTSEVTEKNEWIRAIEQCLSGEYNEAGTRKSEIQIEDDPVTSLLGANPPTFTHFQEVSQCMRCHAEFSTFKRKHHCYACGKVICGKCGGHFVQLEYACDKSAKRVCDSCYKLSTGECSDSVSEESAAAKASSPECLQQGFVQFSTDDMVTWTTLWCAVHSNAFLYLYKANQDRVPVQSYLIEQFYPQLCTAENKEKVLRISSLGAGKQYWMQTTAEEQLEKWHEAMKICCKGPPMDNNKYQTIVTSGSS